MDFFLFEHPDPLIPANELQGRFKPKGRVVSGKQVGAWHDAQGLLSAAQKQADAIVGGAQKAFDDECRRGYEKGLDMARAEEAEKMIDMVDQVVTYFGKVENEVVSLVTNAIRKIIEGFDDSERVILVVKNALSVVRAQKQVVLRVNPSQIEHVRSRLNELLALYPGVGYLDVMADARLASDACVLESEMGLVEASLEGHIQAVEGAFRKILDARGPGVVNVPNVTC